MKNFFERVGLQFFAEDGGERTTGADSEGFIDENSDTYDDSGFAEGFEFEGFEENAPDEQQNSDGQGDEPQPQAQETQPQAEQNTQGQQTAQQFVSVPYNGQTVNVPIDALTALNNAFGGNIGQILERGLAPQQPVQPQQPSQEALILDAYAKAAGYADRQSYMQAMQQQLNNFEIQNEIKNLQMKYPDTPQEALLGIAQQTVQFRQREQANQRAFAAQQMQKAQQQAQYQAQQKANAEKVRPFLEFYKQYPDVKRDSLDPKFFELVRGGLHPSAAYERLQAEQYKAQLAAISKNQQNAATSIGSMQSSNIESDPFLSGFGL